MLSKMARLLKETKEIILKPVMLVGAVSLVLYLLGMVPGYLQSPIDGVKEYESIAAAESELGFDIIEPSYFPNYIAWPPAKIQGQLYPIPTTTMLFLSSGYDTEALLICQVASNMEDLPITLPWIETVLQETPITISGNKGMLVIGKNANGRVINGVYWKANDFHFIVITIHSVQELMTLASSIHL